MIVQHQTRIPQSTKTRRVGRGMWSVKPKPKKRLMKRLKKKKKNINTREVQTDQKQTDQKTVDIKTPANLSGQGGTVEDTKETKEEAEEAKDVGVTEEAKDVTAMQEATANDAEETKVETKEGREEGKEEKEGKGETKDSTGVPDGDLAPVGKVAILDAANVTRARRRDILTRLGPLMESRRHIIFIENVCRDPQLISNQVKDVREKMPDYKGAEPENVNKDYKERIEQYRKVYEPVGNADGDLTWIRIVDFNNIAMHHIRGYLQGRIVQFLMNMHIKPRPIYLSRHGQSEYNVLKKVGGDSSLSPLGSRYSVALAEWIHTKVLNLNKDGSWAKDSTGNDVRQAPHVRLFTSSLKRTRETARHIKHPVCDDGWVVMRPRVWRNMDEIYAGVFDGMTYAEIKDVAHEEWSERQRDKLAYRYPRGESYSDVIERLDPIINELERQRDPIFLIGHQGILRIVYSYFMGLDREEAPFISIPLNTVIKLTPATYDCKEERFTLISNSDPSGGDPPSG